jgi:hypothetical protein
MTTQSTKPVRHCTGSWPGLTNSRPNDLLLLSTLTHGSVPGAQQLVSEKLLALLRITSAISWIFSARIVNRNWALPLGTAFFWFVSAHLSTSEHFWMRLLWTLASSAITTTPLWTASSRSLRAIMTTVFAAAPSTRLQPGPWICSIPPG